MANLFKLLGVATTVAILSAAGCSRSQPSGPFVADARAGSSSNVPTEPMSAVDQPGAIDAARTEYTDYSAGPSVQLKRDEKPKVVPLGVLGSAPRETAALNEPVQEPPDVIKRQVRAPSEPELPSGTQPAFATAFPTTQTTMPAASKGEYLTIGGVVAEVNGQPVFADQVLAPLVPKLSALAREMDEAQFREAASVEVNTKIRDFVESELAFAAANRDLNAQEKQVANFLTERWRQEQINEAGGSIELAKRRFEERGENFEERVKAQYRVNMTRQYYVKRVWPRIQISATDMRREYERSRATKYTKQDRAKFRLIKIDPAKIGDEKLARDRIEELMKRAATEDFAALAEFSTDPYLAGHGGLLPTSKGDGFFDRGTFAIEKIENAVWSLSPGQVSDVIQDGNVFYIAKLEQKEDGNIMPFESLETQDDIRETLSTQQFKAMEAKDMESLYADAIVRIDPKSVQTALEIAMQRYKSWRGSAK